MKERNNKKDKFDYKGYVSNLGKKGTFYKDKKDSKGTEGTLVSIAEKGVYAMVAKMPFPVLFARADFGTHGTVKCSCGKEYKMVPVNSSDKKGHGNKNKHSYSDNGSYGRFGDNGSKKGKAMFGFLNWYEDKEPDLDDEDDCEKVVEKFKKTLKAFK